MEYLSKEDCIHVFLTQVLNTKYPLDVRKKEFRKQFIRWDFPEFSDVHGSEFELINDMNLKEFDKLLSKYKEVTD